MGWKARPVRPLKKNPAVADAYDASFRSRRREAVDRGAPPPHGGGYGNGMPPGSRARERVDRRGPRAHARGYQEAGLG